MTTDAISEYQPPDDLICRAGHAVVAVPARKAPKFCPRCGQPTISACDGCQAPLPPFAGDPSDTAHCTECGAAYPWRLAQIAHAKRTMDIAARTGNWDDETLQMGYDFVDHLAVLDMSGSRLTAVFGYLERFNVAERSTFTNIGRSMGSESVRQWLEDRDA
jgi:hypothetical protein